MDANKNQTKPFSWGYKSGENTWQNPVYPPPYPLYITQIRQEKFQNWQE